MEYFTADAVRGSQHVASLCTEHDTDDAAKFAKRSDMERREVNSWP